jgi:hypothetical protein
LRNGLVDGDELGLALFLLRQGHGEQTVFELRADALGIDRLRQAERAAEGVGGLVFAGFDTALGGDGEYAFAEFDFTASFFTPGSSKRA